MDTILDFNQKDAKRLDMANKFAAFVFQIVKQNINSGGDEEQLLFDLQKAAFEADMQWVPRYKFEELEQYEKWLIDRVMLETKPVI